MVDVVDIACIIEADTIAAAIARAVTPLRPGASGECEECEWWMPRLVDGRCGYCRDGRKRPDDWEPPTRPASPTATPAAPPIQPENAAMPEKLISPPKPKTIMLPASAQSAIAAVDRYAAEHDVSLGDAAAELISRGIATAIAAPAADAAPPSFDDLLDQLRERMASQEQRSVDDAIADVTARAEAAEARAVAAEGKLDQAKALFA